MDASSFRGKLGYGLGLVGHVPTGVPASFGTSGTRDPVGDQWVLGLAGPGAEWDHRALRPRLGLYMIVFV